MKSAFARELQPNQVVTTTFLVQTKDIRQKKTGEPYLSLQLGDRTGDIDAKMWDNVAEIMHTFDRDDFVKVKGVLQIYQNRLQLNIHKMIKVDERDVDVRDYFPCSKRDPDEMFRELEEVIAGVANPHLRALLEAFFSDTDIASRFRVAPAAKSIHHAYLGGLIEHVLSLCKLCHLVAPHYPDVDLDLLLTGAILHDIGKISELTYARSFGYSNDGQLLGHIAIGLRTLASKIETVPGFPPDLRSLVEHMILSHHGELEFGSPKVPLFPEALLLHHLDNLDSKMECMRAFAERDARLDGCWTAYSTALERVVLKKARYLEGEKPQAAPEAPKTDAVAANGSAMPGPAPLVPPERRPPTDSPFAQKLQRALGKD
ncbi:MAG: HD domain-containing protein [Bryobacteraceae bacterium]|nr:HD domain-containing protein [Bryobacteraceae bacterium]